MFAERTNALAIARAIDEPGAAGLDVESAGGSSRRSGLPR